MGRDVDEKVVSMEFDGRSFERNVSSSISMIEKLKNALSFGGVEKGFDGIENKIKNFDFSPIVNGFENLRYHISAWEVAGITAVQNLTNSAIYAGKRMVSSLSIDQVTAGWSKYEQKTASVQTIMNATGKSIDEVNSYLSKLMWFSDETSYGFTDMTQALGMMTSAGGDIEKLIPLITGVANATAYAGKGASEFSRAMYNLNQSYSMGSLQFMDWKSLELAGIASQDLKQVFIDTGEALGKIKKGEVTIANFGSTLSKKWATTEVMEAAFGKFAEMSEAAYQMVQNGEVDTASEAIERLSGKYDKVSERAFKSAQEAKSFTEAIEATKDAVSSGWMDTAELLFGNYNEAKVMWTDLANELWDIFASGGVKRNEILEESLTSNWTKLTRKILDAGVTMEDFEKSIADLAKGHGKDIDDLISEYGSLEAVFQNGVLSGSELKRVVINLLRASDPKAVDGDLMRYLQHIDELGGRQKIIQSIKNAYNALVEALEPAKEAFREVFPEITSDTISGIIDKVLHFTETLKMSEETATKVKETFKGLFDGLRIGFSFIGKLWESVKKIAGSFSWVTDVLLDSSSALGRWLTNVRESIKEGNLFDSIINTATTVFSNLGTGIGNIVKQVSGISSNPDFKGFLGFLDGLWTFIKDIGSRFGPALEAFGGALGRAFQNGDIFNLVRTLGTVFTSGSIAYAMTTFSDSVSSIGEVFESLQDKIKGSAIKDIATAVGILAGSLFLISLIDPDRLTNSVLAIGSLGAELAATFKAISSVTNDMGVRDAGKITAVVGTLSSSLLLMSLSLKVLSTIEPEELLRSVAALALVMYGLVEATSYMSKMEKGPKGAGTLIAMATSILILSAALKVISTMDGEELISSLIGVAGALFILTSFLNSMKSGSVLGAAGLVVAATGLLLLAGALKALGTIPLNQLGTGIVAMAVSLMLISGALQAMQGSIGGAVALTVVSGALLLIAGAMKVLGSMEMTDVFTALTAMTGFLTVIGVATALVQPLIPSMIALGGAIALVGVGTFLAGAGILMLSAGLAGLGAGIDVLVASIVGSLHVIIVGLISLIPEISQGFTEIILALTSAIVTCVPALSEGFLTLVDGVLESLTDHAPSIIDNILTLIIQLIDGLAQRMPEMIAAVGNLFSSIFSGAFESLTGLDSNALIDAMIGVGMMAALVAACSAIAPLIPSAMVGVLGIGAVVAEIVAVIGLLGAMAQLPGLDFLLSEGGNLLEKIGHALGQFVGGLAGGITEGFTSSLPAIADDLSEFMRRLEPFIQSASQINDGVLDGVLNIAKIIAALSGANFVDSLTSFMTGSSSSLSDFGNELAKFGPYIKQYSDSVKGIDSASVESSANAAKSLSEMAANLPTDGGIFSWFTGNIDMAKFGSSLGEFALSMKSYSDNLAGIDFDRVTASAKSFGALISSLTGVGDISFLAMTSFGQAMSDIATEGIDKFTLAFENSGDKAETSINAFISAATQAAFESIDSIANTFSRIASAAASAMNAHGNDFYSVGAYYIQGLINGINSKASEAIGAASALANSIASATASALDEHSPSKVGFRIGSFFGEGTVNGVASTIDSAFGAGKSLANSARDGLMEALSQARNIIDDNIDYEPTITPVLDLSSVRRNVSSLSGLLDLSPSIGVASNLSAIQNYGNQNGNNYEVVDAIKNLGKHLNRKTGDTYTIGNVSATGDADLENAIKVIVRKATVERRK